MNLLILGGTVFLGRHLTAHALAAGHDVTLFHRGRTGRDLFPGVRRLIGDRAGGDRAGGDRAGGDLTALATGSWDTVFDFSGLRPGQVDATARLLAPRIGHYVFMSSIAVYPHTPQAGLTEDSPTLPPGPDEYPNVKAAGERAAEAHCPGRATSIRAGLISGPGDPFGAFPGWALAMAGAGEVPCAARPEQPLQVTDVRDLAEFLLLVGTTPRPGIFNVVPPPVTFAGMLETCRAATGGTATVRWTEDENVDEHAAFVVQPRDGSEDGVFRLAGDRARAAGYRARELSATARDTVEWARRTGAVFTSPH